MEFPFSVNDLLHETITVLRDGSIPFSSNRRGSEYNSKVQHVAMVADMMGQASAKAQGLKAPITTFHKLQSMRHTLYIMRDDSDTYKGTVVGILKVGRKKLFLVDMRGTTHEVEPLCVLDFYIHESKQRSGYGKMLFERMLQVEGKAPHELAIDRPSSKFLSFLRRHYGLSSYPTQANNFVVFNQFFQGINTVAANGRNRSHQSDMNTNVTLSPSQRVSNLTHSRQSPSKSTGIASKAQSALPLREAASEGQSPNQSDGIVASPHQGSLPSTAGALSPSRSVGGTQQSCCSHPAAQGMENQPLAQTQSMNWTLSGYLQRQKARGDGGVQGTAPYLRLRQSRLGDRATSLRGNMGSSLLQSPPSSVLDCLHYSKYRSGAACYRPVLHKVPYSGGSYFSQRQY